MVLDTAKPKNRKRTIQLGMRGRDAARKLVDSQGVHFTGIHDRFLRDPTYRESQIAIGWTEQKCKEMNEFAKENHTCHFSKEEFKRYQGQWYLTLNKSGKNGLMRFRSDSRAAVSLKNRLHRESGEQVEEPISPQQNRRWHSSSSDSWCFFFVTVGSVYSRWRSTVTDGWCGQVHFTRHFSHAVCGFNYMHITLHGSR